MKPKIIIVGGPNGAGKTTFAYQYRDEFSIKYLGADEIAAELGGDVSLNQIEAGRLFFKRFNELTDNKESVIVESTLSGHGLARKIEDYKSKGYEIHLVFVYLSLPENCVDRVDIRVRKGGHFVPTPDVLRRYLRSINNFEKVYSKIADTWQLFNNDGEVPVEVAFSDKGNTLVINENYYSKFKGVQNGK